MLPLFELNCFVLSFLMRLYRLSVPQLSGVSIRKTLFSKLFPIVPEMINEFDAVTTKSTKQQSRFTKWFKQLFKSKVAPAKEKVESKSQYFHLLHCLIDSLSGNKAFPGKFRIFHSSASKAKELFFKLQNGIMSFEEKLKALLCMSQEKEPELVASLLKLLILHSPYPLIPNNSSELMLNIMKLREVTPEERIHLLKMSLLTLGSEERLLVESCLLFLPKWSLIRRKTKWMLPAWELLLQQWSL